MLKDDGLLKNLASGVGAAELRRAIEVALKAMQDARHPHGSEAAQDSPPAVMSRWTGLLNAIADPKKFSLIVGVPVGIAVAMVATSFVVIAIALVTSAT